jgi:glycosyltransferase involved in cell wall biosynthesis
MKKKKILLLIKGLGRGGAEQLLVNAAPYLDRERFDYRVAYILPWKNALVTELQRRGLPVYCLQGDRRFNWVPKMRQLVKEHEIDLVHSHSPLAAVAVRLALGGTPPHRVYTEHNVWERFHPATYWLNLLTFPRSEYVFTVSDHVRASVRYPFPLRWLHQPPLETLYHGPDPAEVRTWAASDGVKEEFGIPDDALVVGTVANFKTHKGYPYLIQAAAHVKKELPNVRFILIGLGPLEKEMRRRAASLGVDDVVIFAGYREDVPRLAATFDLFALSSIHEGLSIALVEAMSLGVPAVVTNVGGLPEVVTHEEQGFLVPPRDDKALAQAIMNLLKDDDLRERLGDNARIKATSFNIRNAVHRMEEVYEELLA